jgi:hypothetical protein
MDKGTRKKVSEVWNFFDSFEKNIAVCKLCKNKLSFTGSSSNLKKTFIEEASYSHPSQ